MYPGKTNKEINIPSGVNIGIWKEIIVEILCRYLVESFNHDFINLQTNQVISDQDLINVQVQILCTLKQLKKERDQDLSLI